MRGYFTKQQSQDLGDGLNFFSLMKLGFVFVILPELLLSDVVSFSEQEGFSMSSPRI